LGNTWSTPSRIEGAVSVAAAAVVATIAVVAADQHRAGVAWLASAAVLVLAGGIVYASPVAVCAATAALGAACIVAKAPAAPLCALGLFVAAETALWSGDDRLRFTEEPGLRRDRLVLLGVIGSASIAVGATLRLLARNPGAHGNAYSVIAGVSITALAVLITLGVRRLPSRGG
jgi:hypothetical protein